MKPSRRSCDLNSCFFCKGCLKEWHPAIAAHRTTFLIKKGEELFQEGSPVAGIYFLEKGLVKVHRKWGDDKELILRFAKDGDIIGHRGLGNENVFPVTATALEDGSACFIPMEFFHTTLKVNHDFTYELMLFYARELQQSEKKMRNMIHMPVKGRLAHALLLLQDKFGTTDDGYINVQLTRQDIASYAGTTYETVFRILQEFSANNWINKDGKAYRLTDLAELNLLAEMPA